MCFERLLLSILKVLIYVTVRFITCFLRIVRGLERRGEFLDTISINLFLNTELTYSITVFFISALFLYTIYFSIVNTVYKVYTYLLFDWVNYSLRHKCPRRYFISPIHFSTYLGLLPLRLPYCSCLSLIDLTIFSWFPPWPSTIWYSRAYIF